jgi:hypothetical protein
VNVDAVKPNGDAVALPAWTRKPDGDGEAGGEDEEGDAASTEVLPLGVMRAGAALLEVILIIEVIISVIEVVVVVELLLEVGGVVLTVDRGEVTGQLGLETGGRAGSEVGVAEAVVDSDDVTAAAGEVIGDVWAALLGGDHATAEEGAWGEGVRRGETSEHGGSSLHSPQVGQRWTSAT